MTKRSKGMAPLRSSRVHSDPKQKNPSNARMKSNIELLESRSGGRSEDETPISKNVNLTRIRLHKGAFAMAFC
jgi:hypothetical protein